MGSGKFIQTNFTGGVFTRLLDGQVDFKTYKNAVSALENFIIFPHGPIQKRPGWKYVASAKYANRKCRIFPFEYSVEQAYIMEFGHQYIRFYMNNGQIVSGGAPYEIASPYQETDVISDTFKIKYCQSADVFYIFHPGYPTRKLSRTGHTAWILSQVKYNPPATSEQGEYPNATLTPAAVTGNGILFTAGSAIFLPSDVNRVIKYEASRASIVSYLSSTQITCDIMDDFEDTSAIAAGAWQLLGSPRGSITPSIISPVGAICTITSTVPTSSEVFTSLSSPALIGGDVWTVSIAGTNEFYFNDTPLAAKPSRVYANDALIPEGTLGTLGINQWAWGDNDTLGYNTVYVRLAGGVDPDTYSMKSSTVTSYSATPVFRASDVGKYVVMHSGVVKISTVNSETSVSGELLKEMSTADAATNWTLESEIWNATNGYPGCGTFFEERMCVSGVPGLPENVRGSAVGDYDNFAVGTDDADAFDFTIAGRDVNAIRWLEPRDFLLLGTIGGEWKLGPDNANTPMTPLNVIARQKTHYGCADIQPITISDTTLFLQRFGRKVLEFTYKFETDGYVAPDMTRLAENITKGGISSMAYQKEPLSMLWCYRNDGAVIALTYLREEEVIGWGNHTTAGEVESMACIPGNGYDELWAVIKRTINGHTVRYIEMLEKTFTDTAAEYAANKGLNAFYVDCGLTYNGPATTVITGLTHLEGETVSILADGATCANQVVSGGQITLDTEASIVHVGLPFRSLVTTLRLDVMLQDGTAQGRQRRVMDLIARVMDSGTFKYGINEDIVEVRDPDMLMDTAPALLDGDVTLPFDGTFDKDAKITIVSDTPTPLTLIALIQDTEITI